MTIGQRIKKLMEQKGLSTRKLGAAIGVSGVTVHQWVTDKAKPRETALANLSAYFGVPAGWILFGEDAPLAGSSIDDGEFITIPLLSQCAGCGNMSLPQEMRGVQMLKIAREWFRQRAAFFTSFRNLHIVVAAGDSMEPTIKDGDFVIIDSGQKDLRADAIYSLYYGGGIYLKRVQRHPNGHILLISDNARYSPMELSEQDTINIVGRVVLAFNAHKI